MYMAQAPSTMDIFSEEGVFLRNVSAAPNCDHYAVGPPGSQIREVGLLEG